jgi:hypothetical protein
MSNTRYLELDSTYRNRNEWPLAADFEIPISQTGRKGRIDAVDPVSESASLKVWQSNLFDNNPGIVGAAPTLNIHFVSTVLTPVSATTGTVVIIVQSIAPLASAAVIQRQKDYYAAAVVQDTVTKARARIISSTFMGTDSTTGLDRMRLTITTSLGTLATGTALVISDPTDFTSVSSPWIFVPNGRLQNNAYVSTVIHNQTKNQTRPLKDYQSFTHLGRIDTSGSAVGTNNVGPIIAPNPKPWTLTDTYSIRVNAPQLCDDISAVPLVPLLTLEGLEYIPGVAPNHSSFNLNPLLTSTGCDYTGNFLEINYQRLTGTTGLPLTTTTVDLNLVGTVRANDLFVGCSLTITNSGNNSTGETRVITSYDGTTWIATVSPGFSGTPPNNTPYILECPQEAKRIVKYVDYRGTTLPSSLPVAGPFVDFPSTASNKSGFYQGLYIRIGPGVNPLRLITDYVVTTNSTTGVVTRRAFLSSALPAVTPMVASFSITSGVTLPFSYSIAPGLISGVFFQDPASPVLFAPQYACILPFSYDNLNPFVYTGSLVSQQDMVCYEVELLNLVLPNFVLAVAGGGNIAYYPYVYVELSNVSAAGAHLKNILYSNNPNSTRVLFRAAIDDVPNPLNSTFIKIDGDGAVQTIKFKPNDNLRFRVTMQYGQTFETIQDEWFSPSIPNPTAQVSAYFSLKRL